jgi:hypothetical protein
MLSLFDLTAFVIVFIVAALYFALLIHLKPVKKADLSAYMERTLTRKRRTPGKGALEKEKLANEVQQDKLQVEVKEKQCSHFVGYLTTLPKGTPFPDECFGCRKAIQCLQIHPTKTIESFYLAKPEA